MSSLFKLSIFSFFLFSQNMLQSTHPSFNQQMMVQDLDHMAHILEIQYAPKKWKEGLFDWNLSEEVEQVKNIILNTSSITTKEYQILVKKFFSSLKDYHVGISFFSTERASLPFRVRGVNGKYFISYVDREKLSPNVFPFSEGDELVFFGDSTAEEAILAIKRLEVGNNSTPTDLALASSYLTSRVGALGHRVPQGAIKIGVLHKGESKTSFYQLIWDYKPEQVIDNSQAFSYPSLLSFLDKSLEEEKPSFDLKIPLISPIHKTLMEIQHLSGHAEDALGGKYSYVPYLGKIWWENDPSLSFHAYLFEANNKKLVGYIRIPSYLPGSPFALEEFSEIISLFEDRAEALIIDQINNPGGSVFYLYALASMLTDQPLATPKHRIAITQRDVMFSAKYIPLFESIQSDEDAKDILGETFEGTPVTFQMAKFFLNFFRFVLSEWKQGHSITDPSYLYGIDSINPYPRAHFTKPIMVLTNCLDFSGGDFFPAILQDNHRAIIFGEQTAGAGGYVSTVNFPNLNGISYFHYTGSLAERVDNQPIENLGVQPDIAYQYTEEDLKFGYQDYAEAILETVNFLIKE